MIREKLAIHKQYLVVSAPVEFSLIANNGTDKVLRPAGVWQLDCFKLLPFKYMSNYPVFNLELEYDETRIPQGFTFDYYFTNINLGDSLKGVSGDLVELSNYQFDVIKNMLSYSEDFPGYRELSKREFGDIREEYFTIGQISFSPVSKRNVYMGCVIVTKDGLRIPCNVNLLYSPTIDKCFDYRMNYFYRYALEDNELYVKIKSSNIVIQTYENGLFPKHTFVTDNSETEKGFYPKKLVQFSDIDRLVFFLLTDK